VGSAWRAFANAQHTDETKDWLVEQLDALKRGAGGPLDEVRALTAMMFECVSVRPRSQASVHWPELPESSLMVGDFYLDPMPREEFWLKRDVTVLDDSEPDCVLIDGPALKRMPFGEFTRSDT